MNLVFQTQKVDTRKPPFWWLGKAGKSKANNGVTVAAPPPKKIVSNKISFETELTNIDMNRSRPISTIQKKAKLAQGGGDILKNCKLVVQRQLGQGNKSGFVYGPFHPSGARKQELDDCNKAGRIEGARDWESLADSFRPQY